MKRFSSLRGAALLTLAAFLWGIAFVAQSDAAGKLSCEVFICCRFLLGAAVLLPVIAILDLRSGQGRGFLSRFADKTLVKSGLLCGAFLFSASYLQQLSLQLGTSSGKCGFLTATYMILVPLCGLFLGKRVGAVIWVAVGMGLGGMYLLCLTGTEGVAIGDLAVLGSAFLYTGHILAVDRVVDRVDCVRLSCLQFLTAGVLGGIVSLFTGLPSLAMLLDASVSILYVGIFSSGVAYTLQIVGQKTCDAAIAPLLMSLESVFAALAGALLLQERMSTPQTIGCVLIFAAVTLTQLPPSLFSRRRAGMPPSNS